MTHLDDTKPGYQEPGTADIENFRKETERHERNTHHRDAVRSRLATRLFLLIAVLSIMLVGAAIAGRLDIDGVKDISLAVLAPPTAVFAIIVGFFFGSESRDR